MVRTQCPARKNHNLKTTTHKILDSALLFADESLNNPLFDISANQNGNLMFDSVLSLGLFNDRYHYRDHFKFEDFYENFKRLKLFYENEINECIVFCETLKGE